MGDPELENVQAVINRWINPEEQILAYQYPEEIKKLIQQELRTQNLSPDRCVVLSTAVPQSYRGKGFAQDEKTGLTVQTIATGSLGNAMAPGDPALYNEENIRFKNIGTINIIVAVNRLLTVGARFEMIAKITEAKCAVVANYRKLSPSSHAPCFGTGTDCIALCWRQDPSVALRYAGSHTKLGELTGSSVVSALTETFQRRYSKTNLGPANF